MNKVLKQELVYRSNKIDIWKSKDESSRADGSLRWHGQEILSAQYPSPDKIVKGDIVVGKIRDTTVEVLVIDSQIGSGRCPSDKVEYTNLELLICPTWDDCLASGTAEEYYDRYCIGHSTVDVNGNAMYIVIDDDEDEEEESTDEPLESSEEATDYQEWLEGVWEEVWEALDISPSASSEHDNNH